MLLLTLLTLGALGGGVAEETVRFKVNYRRRCRDTNPEYWCS